MTFATDIADDFADVVDGLEAVTLQISSEVAWATLTIDEWAALSVDEWAAMLVDDTQATSIAGALRRQVTTREQRASEGKYRANDVVWHFAASEVSADPVPGEKIIDASLERWTILEASEQTLLNRWRCTCRNMAVSEELQTLVTIQQATWAKDTDGAEAATWADYRTDVRAKIARVGVNNETEHEKRHAQTEVEIYTEDLYSVDQNHRVVADNGVIYNVTGYREPEAIDQLPVILAEVNTWPLG